jgi:hypothetical protein
MILCQVVVATVAFGQGFNGRSLLDSVSLGLPKTVAQTLQQGGRVACDPATTGRAVVLAQTTAYFAAEKYLKARACSILFLLQFLLKINCRKHCLETVESKENKHQSDDYEQREGPDAHYKGLPHRILQQIVRQ